MRQLLFLFLTGVCLFLSTAPILQVESFSTMTNNTANTTASITTKAPAETSADGTNDMTSSLSSTHKVTAKDEHENTVSTNKPQTTHSDQAKTKPTMLPKQSNSELVVTLLLIIVAVAILLFLLFRWYQRNPDRRSIHGLRDSMVETGQLAWGLVTGCMQQTRKQPEEVEDGDELGEMERGSEGERMEEGITWGGVKQEENDSDSDESDSTIDGANLTEGEKTEEQGEDRRSAKEDSEDTEDMHSVMLEEEDKADTEGVDDLTPL